MGIVVLAPSVGPAATRARKPALSRRGCFRVKWRRSAARGRERCTRRPPGKPGGSVRSARSGSRISATTGHRDCSVTGAGREEDGSVFCSGRTRCVTTMDREDLGTSASFERDRSRPRLHQGLGQLRTGHGTGDCRGRGRSTSLGRPRGSRLRSLQPRGYNVAVAEKILIVEDERNMASLVGDVPEERSLHRWRSPVTAPRHCKGENMKPDLVVLDLMLPDIDGLEVCRQIRATSTCRS